MKKDKNRDLEMMCNPEAWPPKGPLVEGQRKYLCLKRYLPQKKTMEFATLHYEAKKEKSSFRCHFEPDGSPKQADQRGDESLLNSLIDAGWLVD